MCNYCKAYSVEMFRQYDGWNEKAKNIRKETEMVDGNQVEVERELTDEDILYLQENYQVTDGIFLDEKVIFDDVTPEWINFCKGTLEFEIPEREPVRVNEPAKSQPENIEQTSP
jgi:hypothetical protein